MAPIKINVKEDNGIKHIISSRCRQAGSVNFASMPSSANSKCIYCRDADRGRSKKVEKPTLITLILSKGKDRAYP